MISLKTELEEAVSTPLEAILLFSTTPPSAKTFQIYFVFIHLIRRHDSLLRNNKTEQ